MENRKASRRVITGRAVITLLACLLFIAASACASSGDKSDPAGPPRATQVPTKVPNAGLIPPLNVMGSPEEAVQAFLWGSSNVNRDLKMTKDAGFKWVKQMFQWNYIEKEGKGKFEWNEPDRLVGAAEKNGLKMLARVDFAPMWARPKGADPKVDGPPADYKDFGDFMSALAARYKGRIQAYQIWNEPNLARDWGDQPPNAADYVRLLKIAYEAIKAADPQALVITAGLSPTTASGAIATPDMEYLQRMYDAGARAYYDMLGVHAAGYKAPPEADPGTVAKDPAMTNNDPSPEKAKRIYSFRHAEDLRKIMVQNGDEAKRVAILEFGWTSDPRPNSPYKWHSVTEDQKAKYIVGAYDYANKQWQPWVGVMSLIYIAAPYWTAEDEQYWWSITDQKGNPRPAYDAVRAMLKN